MESPPSSPDRLVTLDTVKKFVMLFKTYTDICFSELLENIEEEFVPFPSKWKEPLLSLFVFDEGEGNERQFDAKFRFSMSSCDEEFEQSRIWLFRYAIEAWDLLKEGRLTINPLPTIEFTILQMQFVATLRPFLIFANIVQPFCEEFKVDLTSNLASQLEERYRSLSKSSLAWTIGKDNAVTTDEITQFTLTTHMRGWIRKYAPRKKILSFSVTMKFRSASEAEKLIAEALEIHLDGSTLPPAIPPPILKKLRRLQRGLGPRYTTSPCSINCPLTVRLPALEETGNLPEAEATTQYIIATAQGETPEECHPADSPIEILDDGNDDSNNIKVISDDNFLQHALLEPPAPSPPPSKSDFSALTTAIGNAPGSDVQQNQYLLNPILINHGLPGLDRGDDKIMLDIQEELPLFQSLDGNVHDYFDWLASYPPHEYMPYPFPDQLEIAWHGGPPSSFEAYIRNAVVREEEEMMN